MMKEPLFRNKLLNDYAHELNATDGSINEQLNVNDDLYITNDIRFINVAVV